jgi:o-succinylbenzoate synthase
VIWTWRYELKTRRPLSALAGARTRHGALIRTESGFADVHPWPELGDATLDEQLARLARGETTALTSASLRLAKVDGEARERGVSLFEGVTIPESHWPGPDPPPSFDTAKIKWGAGAPAGDYRLRIDFNAMLTASEFEQNAKTLPRDRIDFVEDPCPYDAATWRALRDRTGFRFALDREFADDGVDVLVVKPAIQEVPPLTPDPSSGKRGEGARRAGEGPQTTKEIVVTSYMDHPVGQLGAAFIAAKHATSSRCGLVTHVLFDSNEFIEQLGIDGMRLVPPPGTGIGFDDLLERLPWKRLR